MLHGFASGTCFAKVSRWLLKIDCPFHNVTHGGKVSVISVVEWISPVGRQRGLVNGAMGERAETLGGRTGALLGRAGTL